MEPPERGALGFVRLIGGCLIIIALLDAGMYLTEYLTPYFELHQHIQAHPAPLKTFRLFLDAIPVIAGIVILVKARAIAEWLSDIIQ